MRIVARLLVLLPLLWLEGAWAVDCASDNYFLKSQAEVNALGATGCDRVVGYLRIEHIYQINSLDPLINITSVGSELRISRNSNVRNLNGLANLTNVGGLVIEENSNLTNIDGLANLTSVENSVRISRNPALTNLDGLTNLSSVGSLHISANHNLANVYGLASVSSVVGSLSIGGEALTNVDGLINITSVGGNVYVAGRSLTNLDGLANLTSVGDSLYIGGPVTNVDGLAKLTSIGGRLEIGGTTDLSNVDGLSSLTNVGGDLTLVGNDAVANLDGLANITSVGGALQIIRNNKLTGMDGLTKLTRVESDLLIEENLALTNLDGLANITRVGGALDITNNRNLANLNGLANLNSVGGYLKIAGNRRFGGTNCQGVAPVLGWPNGPDDDAIDGSISVEGNGSGCDSVEEILTSVSGPTRPTILNAAATGESAIRFDFSASTNNETLFPVTGYEATCTGTADLSEEPAALLLDNSPVSRTLTASGGIASHIEIEIDITHSRPEHLVITLTSPQGSEAILWNQGGAGTENLIGTFPKTLTPVGNLGSLAGQAMEGDWVLQVEDVFSGPLIREGVLNAWGLRISENLTAAGPSSPITVNGVTSGRDYSCTVAPLTRLGTYPSSEPSTVRADVPSVPIITSTDYEDGKIILTVSVTDNGGQPVTRYEATCTDGANTYTGTSTSSPITVSGLTNDVAYTCTVTATNSVGTSSASAATAPITPEETATGLPIWLLYQATQ